MIQADDSRSGAWLPPDHPDLQVSGRVSWTEQNKLRVIWPGTQIQGRFTGRSLAVQLEDTGRTDYQVIIDVDLKNSRLLDTVPGFHVYPLAQNLAAGEHRSSGVRKPFQVPARSMDFFWIRVTVSCPGMNPCACIWIFTAIRKQ
ncbi:MAG TPA: hypothetical protein VE954_25155 [Oligoflexus sp.]|uniref:hypothetical protein n=1 Tax=Oligoflexus sp. TaxID=1971216 RepID=UPI002D2F07EA|nr:hypothetical protein [Oligoflexus sp.]HYX36408.1 hypothetical protein [Oligoflexus sp.]